MRIEYFPVLTHVFTVALAKPPHNSREKNATFSSNNEGHNNSTEILEFQELEFPTKQLALLAFLSKIDDIVNYRNFTSLRKYI
jgi:hypothetical protein